MSPIKHVASKRKVLKKGSSSRNPQNADENVEVDPYYTPDQQAERFARYASRKMTHIRYADLSWFVGEGFQFPVDLETQGLTHFVELHGNVYPDLVKEFYANFQFKDECCITMVKGMRILLNKRLFLDVAGIVDEGTLVNDCSEEKWSMYDAVEMYKSCLKNPNLYVQGSTNKAGSLTVENRFLHYLVVYILSPRLTNLAQPSGFDLQLMFAIKEGIMLNWFSIILNNIYDIAMSAKKPLAYGIFISRIVDFLGIETRDETIQYITDRQHLFGESLIHQMQIYKYAGEWMHQNDYDPVVDLDLDEDMHFADEQQDEPQDQAQDAQGSQNAQQAGFDNSYVDAMEQRLIGRMDAMEERMLAEFRRQELEMKTSLDHLTFLFSTFGAFNQPPPPPNP